MHVNLLGTAITRPTAKNEQKKVKSSDFCYQEAQINIHCISRIDIRDIPATTKDVK